MRGEALVAVIVLYIMTRGCLSKTTNCSCTYSHRKLPNSRWEVVPFAGGRNLNDGEAVPVGATVKFLCTEHLWHRMDGPTELVCGGCNRWSSSEFPTCRDPHNPFDPAYKRSSQSVPAHIVWSDNPFLNLQANGSLVFTPGKNYSLICESSVQPLSWSVPEKADVIVYHDITMQFGSSWKVHSKILEIREANANHSGVYRCEDGNGDFRRFELVEGNQRSKERISLGSVTVLATPERLNDARKQSSPTFDSWKLVTEPCKVPSISNGQIGVYERNEYHRVVYYKRLPIGDIVDDDQQLIFKCKTNFLPLGIRTTEIKVSCRHGQWSHGLQCQPVPCTTSPPPVPNARVGSVGTEHGGAVVYLCSRFHTKARSGNITCEFGAWQGVTPICRDTRCDLRALKFPGLVSEAEMKRHYLPGETYAPACDKGFSVNGQLSCDDGIWKGHFPPCKTAQCDVGALDSPGLVSEAEMRRHYLPGENYAPTCDKGFSVNGQLSCDDGIWKGHFPPCTAAPASYATDCSCTYNNSRWGVTPFAVGRKLDDGKAVPVGATVTFLCTRHLWHRMDGPTELVCSGCDRWSSPEFPTCQDPHDGEVHIVWSDGPFLRLQSNGSVVFTPGKDYRLYCGSSARPLSWSVPEKANVTVFREMQIQIGSDVQRVKFLHVREANANHSGVYRCEDGNGRSRQLELVEGDPGCGRVLKPAGSTLTIEPDKEFYVLGQSYTFRCPPAHRASSDAQRVFCLRSGWSEDTVPDCIPLWQD